MKKRTRRMFTRVCSLVLAGLLATSTYVAVATESPVSATWEPQPQSTDGVRQVGLSLALSDTSSAVAAMVEIHLDENEAAALQWDGSTIPVGELKPAGPEEPEGTSSGESSESSSGESSESSSTESSETTSGESSETTSGESSGTASGESSGTTSGESGETPSTDSNDVSADTTMGPPAPSEETHDLAVDVASLNVANWFVFKAAAADGETEETPVAPQAGAVLIDAVEDGKKVLRVLLTETSRTYTKDLTFQTSGGDVTVSLVADDIVYKTYNKEDSIPGITKAPLLGSGDGISKPDFTASSFTVYADLDSQYPGAGGWDVEPSEYEVVTQKVFWADNNNYDGLRPNWIETIGEEPGNNNTLAPTLTFTLTTEDGNTTGPYTLNKENSEYLSWFGFSADNMPKISEVNGELRIPAPNQNGLPTKLEEEFNGGKGRTFTVEWTLEPPDLSAGSDEEEGIDKTYAFLNIEKGGENSDYLEQGYVRNEGWYFVQKQDFVINLSLQDNYQGDTLTEDEVEDLMANFTFHWDYDGMPEGMQNQSPVGGMMGAEVTHNDKAITVSGLWKYSLNGNPISYYLQESADDGEQKDTADGKLSGAELSSSIVGVRLDAEDWYTIHYNNTGVPNEGHSTNAVYNGGTLQLIRDGIVQYTATKNWVDEYGQEIDRTDASEMSGSPLTVDLTLYRYVKGAGIASATIYNDNGVRAQLVWDEGTSSGGESGETEDAHWEIQVVTGTGDTVSLADLPKYDPQSGQEWVYVVQETPVPGYEQVFGTVTWDPATYSWVKTLDDLQEEWGEVREGNSYLYNGDTLTNLKTDTISASATKEWRASTYQSTFDQLAVELQLQVRRRPAGSADESAWEEWLFYGDVNGNTSNNRMTRYLYGFSDMHSEIALEDTGAYPAYTYEGNTRYELEYRWIETAVAQIEGDKTADSVKEVFSTEDEHVDIKYDENTGIGSYDLRPLSWEVTYEDNGQIVNSVKDTAEYEIVKEWHGVKEGEEDTLPHQITLQLFRTVTGEEFNYQTPYLEFTWDGEKVGITGGSALEENATITIDPKAEFNYTSTGDQPDETWKALIEKLPALDPSGNTYEYILLEKYEQPVYRNEPTTSANYRTVIINGPGEGGFNLLIRKSWLDDSDTLHRHPITVTLYNKYTGEPLKRADGKGNYTITLGDGDIWTSIFWVGDESIDTGSKTGQPDGEKFDADDIYVVETSLEGEGTSWHVDYTGENGTEQTSYDSLYVNKETGEVLTDYHRYEVTHEISQNHPDSVGAAFTISNRRLGFIDLTVNKRWVDGRIREGMPAEEIALLSDDTLSDQIGEELVKIYDGGNGTKLALVFKLKFDGVEEDEETGWIITRYEEGGDKVAVGGYPVPIYSDKDGEIYEGDDKQAGTYIKLDYSVQPIIGLKENGTGYTTSNEIHFFGLPKYDQSGAAVSYTVEELWMKKTNNGWVEVTDDDLKSYTGLYELWAPYNSVKTGDEYQEDVIGQDQLDLQTITVTNSRGGTKEVIWIKDWRDNFTNESGLRPDVYLQIYGVVHVQTETNNEGKPIYERRIQEYGTSGNWVKDDDDTWTLRLNLPAYDDYGFEIFYYAVEQTSQPAQDYDYQMPEYYLDKQPLGNANEPIDGAEVLNSDTEQQSGDYAYDLLMLYPTDLATDEATSIPWKGNVPTFDATFPKYALIENGTFSNTLAEDYSIEGMKYWTSLPVGWLVEGKDNLPGVRFIVYRYTSQDQASWGEGQTLDDFIKDTNGKYITDEEGCKYYAAQLTIESDDWEGLRSGTGYRYCIQYNGVNTLADDGSSCTSVENASKLERYDEDGRLYTYEIREVVQWDLGVTVDGDQVFTVSNSSNGFYFTNTYDPDKGSIKVKKFLYLPMETKADGTKAPTAYPAVTFKLVREVDYGDGTYVADTSFATQTVTITSAEVKEAWNAPSFVATMPDYVTLYAQFNDLPIYAPNGTQYYYTVIEDRDELQGYDTFAKAEDVDNPDEVDGNGTPWNATASAEYPNCNVNDGVAITGLEPTKVDEGQEPSPDLKSAATFKNKQEEPSKVYNQFTATKVWDDNNNEYQFRPDAEKFKDLLSRVKTDANGKVTWTALKRTARSQTDQKNPMTEYLVPGKDYTLTVTGKTTDGQYSISITPMENSGEFDYYAPNGMPWTYTFSEPVANNRLEMDPSGSDSDANSVYAPVNDSPSVAGQWATTITAPIASTGSTPSATFGSLTNSVHLSYSFNKEWKDEQNNSITEDYLGFDLAVKFQLQVTDNADGPVDWNNWTDASDYFDDQGLIGVTPVEVQQGTGTEWDTATITGFVDDGIWGTGGAFTNLPTARQDNNGNYILLQYRVIETEVSYGDNQKQMISGLKLDAGSGEKQTGKYENVGSGLVTSATFERTDHALSISTNMLNTTSVSVTKVWDDTNNLYGTRPGANGPWSWTSWFVLQRKTESTDWENVAIFDSLYGSDDESNPNAANSGNWVATISGLPVADYKNGGASYTYRVRELQPKDGGYDSEDVNNIAEEDIVEQGGIYNTAGFNYKTTYTGPSGEENLWTVTNALGDTQETEEITAKKVWANDDHTDVDSVTFQLQYKTADTDWQMVDFLGDGASAELIANEGNNWTVTWTTLPSTLSNGTPIAGYRVVEVTDDGWVQIGVTEPDFMGLSRSITYEYTFTNSVTTSYSVEKVWNPADLSSKPSVTIGLYRTTADGVEVGSINGESVPVDEMDAAQGVQKVTLPKENAWEYTFNNLPKYNSAGQPYLYYALELDKDGNPIADGEIKTLIDDGDYKVSYDWTTNGTQTTVTNTPTTYLRGAKTWVDNGNAYGTRPDGITLKLERKTKGTEWSEVSGVDPEWTKTGNTWNYTYSNLPGYNEKGKKYTYQVTEVPVEGYTPTQQGVSFTNTLAELLDITGQKIWSGGVGEDEPVLTLERRLDGTEDEWEEVENAEPVWTKNGSIWTFTFSDLPKYDANGALYEYRVVEAPLPGYTTSYTGGTIPSDYDGHPDTPVEGLTIVNHKDGSLIVNKTVSGNWGDTDADFTFTVTLTGETDAGQTAETVTGTFTTRRTDAGGNATDGIITFNGGVSGRFTLKDGESLTILGLPAGIGYTVTEAEADQNGYTTTGTGWTGTIPAGGTAEAAFENYRSLEGGGGDRTDITGKKVWIDGGETDPVRPGQITLRLYRQVSGGPLEEVNAQPTWVKSGDTWIYTFRNLPEADRDGNRYTYSIREVVPEGYESSQNGNTIINRKVEEDPGSFEVSKIVTGLGGDPTARFTFTVTLSEPLTGIYGGMTFVDGVAAFTLSGGESILAENLPDGVTYTVTEAEANQDGYTTTVTGGTGTISAGQTASAVFTNDRPRTEQPEPSTPDNPDVPKTDDPTHNGLLAGLCLASLGGMAVLGLVSRRNRKKYRGKHFKKGRDKRQLS